MERGRARAPRRRSGLVGAAAFRAKEREGDTRKGARWLRQAAASFFVGRIARSIFPVPRSAVVPSRRRAAPLLLLHPRCPLLFRLFSRPACLPPPFRAHLFRVLPLASSARSLRSTSAVAVSRTLLAASALCATPSPARPSPTAGRAAARRAPAGLAGRWALWTVCMAFRSSLPVRSGTFARWRLC